MSHRAYNIPTISHDLTREESIAQIANTLEYLDHVCNDVFSRIGGSIEDARNKIKSFDERINLIDLKISKIKGSNKAIQICSSGKYPVNIENDDIPKDAEDPDNFYEAVKFIEFKSKHNTKLNFLNNIDKKVQLKHKLHKYATQYQPLDELMFKDKFKEFSVDKVFKYDSTNLKDLSNLNAGLGNILSDRIESITSLLLFNTAQHPYKQANIRNPLGDLDTKKKKNLFDQSDAQNDIYEAPQSILKGEQMDAVKREDIGFKPKLGDVPDFNVPTFLPELSGIADISYAQELPSIAPSNLITDDLPDILPEIAPDIGSNSTVLPMDITSSSASTINANIMTQPGSMSAPPPPPPPPPVI